MTLREFAKEHDHEIVGKLTRRPEWERKGYKHYSDEAGNEYIISKTGCCIVTADDAVI